VRQHLRQNASEPPRLPLAARCLTFRHVGMLRSAEKFSARADRRAQHDPTSGKFNSRIVNSLDLTGPNAATARLQPVETLAAFWHSPVFTRAAAKQSAHDMRDRTAAIVSSPVSYLPQRQHIPRTGSDSPHCGRIPRRNAGQATGRFLQTQGNAMMRIVIAAGAMLAVVTAAAAADLPHRQPVYQQAQVGKMPIGKSPIGKSPIGKYPVGKTPVASRY
jgi:hypothetical protein